MKTLTMETGQLRKDYLPFGKPSFSDQEIEAVTNVLRAGWVGMGPVTMEFEKELASYVGAPYVVTVNSCTSALFLALKAIHNVGPGDEVICPSFTWCSTANAALYVGAKPVLCDVDPKTLCISPESIRSRVTPRTKAVMVVHFGGYAVDIDAIKAAVPHHVAIIEDAAHAFGARYPNGRMVGTSGNLTCYSFYANKNLSTGEGGAIACYSERIANWLRSLRQHALPIDAWKRFSHAKSILLAAPLEDLGYKMNYTDLQASIGRVQLQRQGDFNQRRKQIAELYYQELSKVNPPLWFQKDCLDSRHARHLFVVGLPVEQMTINRYDYILKLRDRNVGATVHYTPLHSMPLYQHDPDVVLANTDYISERIVTLPISSSMSLDDARYVVKHVVEVLEQSLK